MQHKAKSVEATYKKKVYSAGFVALLNFQAARLNRISQNRVQKLQRQSVSSAMPTKTFVWNKILLPTFFQHSLCGLEVK